MTEEQSTTEDELEAALAALDQDPLPSRARRDPTPSADEAGQPSAPVSTGSPTLDALDESRRPKASTVCEHCPNSVWFASPAEVKCYCRVMFLITWSSQEPNRITHCDGVFLGQEAG
jgi:hypothetical protein